jgi:hypothetical protein
LNADVSNPQHQEMLSKLGSLYVPSVGDLLLLDWIVAANLPFRAVNTPEFRRWAMYRNPGGSLQFLQFLQPGPTALSPDF